MSYYDLWKTTEPLNDREQKPVYCEGCDQELPSECVCDEEAASSLENEKTDKNDRADEYLDDFISESVSFITHLEDDRPF